MNQIKLGTLLGTWMYQNGDTTKYWRVLVHDDTRFVIRWAPSLRQLEIGKDRKIIVEDSEEVYRRILSKARGQYQHISEESEVHWNPKCSDEFNSITETIALEQQEYRKRKPRKRKLSLLEWVGGLDETRQDEKI